MPRSRAHTLLTGLVLATWLMIPHGLEAQDIDSPYRFVTTQQGFGLRVGYGSFGSGSLGIEPGSGPLFGLFYGVDLGGPWSFDIGGTVHFSERDVIDPTQPEEDRVIGQTDANFAEFGVRLRFGLTGDRTWHGVNPFIAAGAGLGLDFAGASTLEQQLQPGDEYSLGTSFVPTLGTGARYFPKERIELRSEFGGQLWSITPPASFRSEDRLGPTITGKEWVRFFYASFTVSLRF